MFQLNWNRKLLNYRIVVGVLCLLMAAVYFLHCWLRSNRWNRLRAGILHCTIDACQCTRRWEGGWV